MEQHKPPGIKHTVAIGAGLLLFGIADRAWAPPPPPGSGTFTSTVHGSSTAGVDRSDTGVLGGALGDSKLRPYSKGNCAHCHEMHASISGGEPTPVGGTANWFSLFRTNYNVDTGGSKNEVCYYCHEVLNVSTTAVNYGRYDVYMGKTAAYVASSHNTSANVVWPTAGPPAPAVNDAGNCNNCHNPHGYDDGSAFINPIPSMVFKREQTLCLECHDGSPAAAARRIDLDIAKTYRHQVATYTDIHSAGEDKATLSANKHVECVDCHNPHMATRTSARTKGSNAISAANSPLYGVKGVSVSFSGTNWTAPSYAATYKLPATAEFEICFKCHSAFNTNVLTWGGAGALAWTDVGLEFSTSNQSYHPVAGALPAADPGANGSSRLNAAQLIGTDRTWTPGQTMYCSDCHASDSTPAIAGPHGSAIKWMLVGTYKNWPFQTSANNGSSTATNWAYLTNGAAQDDTFCRNCHPDTSSTNSNNVHTTGDHQNSTDGRCLTCHIRVPHGGKVSRLINAAFTATNLPNRYWPNGNGGGFTPEMMRFVKTAYRSYSGGNSNCYARTCRSSHNVGSGETW